MSLQMGSQFYPQPGFHIQHPPPPPPYTERDAAEMSPRSRMRALAVQDLKDMLHELESGGAPEKDILELRHLVEREELKMRQIAEGGSHYAGTEPLRTGGQGAEASQTGGQGANAAMEHSSAAPNTTAAPVIIPEDPCSISIHGPEEEEESECWELEVEEVAGLISPSWSPH